jgi:hypothetical protein
VSHFIKPGDIVTCYVANGGEIATYQDFTVGLYGYRINSAIYVWVKAGIKGTVCVEPGDVISLCPTDAGELTSYQYLAVSLKCG